MGAEGFESKRLAYRLEPNRCTREIINSNNDNHKLHFPDPVAMG
jgi:hypothetical protein